MPLILNEEQQMLQDAANGFLIEKAPVSAFRGVRDGKPADGFRRELWTEMAQMGWAGIIVEEAHGGSGFGYVGAGVLAEQMGRNLTASPFFSTSVLGATAIQQYGTKKQKEENLAAISSGEKLFALAVDEGPRHNPSRITFSAKPAGNGFVLSGTKTFVADGHVADKLIIAARTSERTATKMASPCSWWMPMHRKLHAIRRRWSTAAMLRIFPSTVWKSLATTYWVSCMAGLPHWKAYYLPAARC